MNQQLLILLYIMFYPPHVKTWGGYITPTPPGFTPLMITFLLYLHVLFLYMSVVLLLLFFFYMDLESEINFLNNHCIKLTLLE